MAAQGRIAWTTRGKDNQQTQYCRIKDLPRDGIVPTGLDPEHTAWYQSVHHGVVAIQQLLLNKGHLEPDTVTGMFGWHTKQAVEQYQADQEIAVDGKVGQQTMDRLLRPPMARAASAHNFHPKWLYGLGCQESGLDPGAQGASTPADFGVWQFNTATGPLTVEEAFNVPFASLAVAARFKEAMNKYAGKSHHLQIDCAIIQHRSPIAADFLFEHEEAYGPESKAYVLSVRGFANHWDD